MTLTQPLKWHGGKHYLAERIVALMPLHVHYVEPYFGGGAVLLAKNPINVSEVVNDINGELMNFWTVLASPTHFPEFCRIMGATPFIESWWNEASVGCTDWLPGIANPAIKRAIAFFVACRQSRAGTFKDFATLSRSRTRRGMNEQASAWLTAIEGLPAVHARLKRVVILNRDAIDVIRTQDGPETLFYLDPTYLHETRVAIDAYEHEMTRGQHVELLTTLRSIKGKVMLSGYPSDLYAEMLHDWTRYAFDLPNNAAGGEEKRRMTECLWCNTTRT